MTETIPEFSRPVALEELGDGAVRRDIEATTGERRRLARRFGLPAIDALTARVVLEGRDKGRTVVARGEFTADVTQSCVVTLEPLRRDLSETFSVRMAAAPDSDDAEIVDVDPTSADDPEPIEGDSIDIGELVAQHVALALDPYPRADDAEIAPEALRAGDAETEGPFAELARLRQKD